MDKGIIALICLLVLFVAINFAREVRPALFEPLVGSQQPARCGVDLPACPSPLRCGNGVCIPQETTMPIESYPLPVYPAL